MGRYAGCADAMRETRGTSRWGLVEMRTRFAAENCWCWCVCSEKVSERSRYGLESYCEHLRAKVGRQKFNSGACCLARGESNCVIE